MNFESHSQAGQDRFAWELLGPGPGTFLDIGANHPVEISNTYALEQMGWTGILVENDAHCVELLKAQRKSRVIAQDATTVDWRRATGNFPRVDYLSLDVDEASLTVLENLLKSGLRFKALTVEHDAYRFGKERRNEMYMLLVEHGYKVLCAEVCDNGLSFEMWAVDPESTWVSPKAEERFLRCWPTDWKEFFA